MEESLGEATDREQELLMAKRSLETRLDEAQRSLARLTQEHQELNASYQEEQRQKEQLKRAKNELEEQKRLLDRTTEKLNKEVSSRTPGPCPGGVGCHRGHSAPWVGGWWCSGIPSSLGYLIIYWYPRHPARIRGGIQHPGALPAGTDPSPVHQGCPPPH